MRSVEDARAMRTINHWIGGKPDTGRTERRAAVWNPATGEQQAWVALANPGDVNRAVTAAADERSRLEALLERHQRRADQLQPHRGESRGDFEPRKRRLRDQPAP